MKNVLVAGLYISCVREFQGSVRVMPVCLAMGEAAGIGAALAAKLPSHDVHTVDVSLVRKLLCCKSSYRVFILATYIIRVGASFG